MIAVRWVIVAVSVTLASALCGCVGTAGGELFELDGFAAGPEDATGRLEFESSRGYRVELTEARLLVGGVYLNRARATSVASDTSCTLPGIYVAELLTGREVDLLSSEPQAFPRSGFATSDRASTGEVWLTAGDVNQTDSSATVLHVAGVATRDDRRFPFVGDLTIGENRAVPPTDPALPGQHPICKQRIVTPIPVNLAAKPNLALLLRIDPRGMFGNVDFESLAADGDGYSFADAPSVNQASDNLYAGLHRSTGVYSFSWMERR